MKRTVALWITLAVSAVGCDDSSDGGGDDAGTEAMAWDELDQQGRQMFMAQQVLPAMQSVFAEIDERYATGLQCGTCHGSDLMAFAMPSDITPLSGAELATFTFDGEGRQEIANAMAAQVVPRMAELLGQEPFDPATNTGTFGCASCHQIQ